MAGATTRPIPTNTACNIYYGNKSASVLLLNQHHTVTTKSVAAAKWRWRRCSRTTVQRGSALRHSVSLLLALVDAVATNARTHARTRARACTHREQRDAEADTATGVNPSFSRLVRRRRRRAEGQRTVRVGQSSCGHVLVAYSSWQICL